MMLRPNEIIVDSFAGGGGASTGIELALGRPVDVAINHNPAAITMHARNHPATKHFTEDVFKLRPRDVTGGKPVGLLWASPDCRHFSRAKGSKPVKKEIRGLAWVVVKWAAEVKPRVIILENVREFQDWGPLVPRWKCAACEWTGTEGQVTLGRRGKMVCPRCDSVRVVITEDSVPCPDRKGLTFRQFTGRLRAQGYAVDHRVLDAADFGAPTHRKRLFLVARRDGAPICWPEPTHGDPKKIGRGLFDRNLKPWRTAAECIDWSIPCPSIFERKKPLAEKTLKRIALGIKRYVLDNPTPFIVGVGGRAGQSPATGMGLPLGTITGKNDRALLTPIITPVTHTGERRSYTPEEPLPTITGAHRGELAVIAPIVYRHFGRSNAGASIEAPAPTTMAGGMGKTALVAAFLAKHFGGVVGVPADVPLPTTTARGTQTQIVAANLVHMNHGDKTASGADEPMRAVTAGGNHAALVYAFLTKYFGCGVGQMIDDPLHTVTAKDRFAIVTVSGVPHVITDIGMRMLRPRELANAQGFPADYVLTGTATNQVERIGNSVCPDVAAAVVAANLSPVMEAV